MTRRLAFASLLWLTSACDPGAELVGWGSDAAAPPPQRPRKPAPAPPAVAEGTLRRIGGRAEVPLEGPRVEAKAGDWVLENQGAVAVVSGDKGRLVDFGPSGGADGMYYVDSVAFDALERMHVELATIEPAAAGARALHVVRRVLDKPLTMHVWYALAGASLRIESMLVAEGRMPILAVTLGEILSWGNTPTWVEGYGAVTQGGSFGGEFLARDHLGLAYAACSHAGRLMARFSSPDPAGFYYSARTGEETVEVPVGGASARRAVSLAFSTRSLGDAVDALPCVHRERTSWTLPGGLPDTTSVEVARCPTKRGAPVVPLPPPARVPSAPVGEPQAAAPGAAAPRPAVDALRAGAPYGVWGAASTRGEIQLPRDGCFLARLTAPGHLPGPWTSPSQLATSTGLLPTAGTLRWRVTEGAAPLPAKVLVRGVAPTVDPSWGEDPTDGAAANAVYSAEGAGERPLPPGTYKIVVQRGPEYTVHEQNVVITAGAASDVTARLDRVVDTTGWISADLHIHAMPSFDAPAPLADRVRSLAAVAVEVAVATDHNAVTDYAPAIRELGLADRIASIVGNEVTTREVSFGHFNAFPLPAGSPPVVADGVQPKPLFRALRAAAPAGRDMVIQVNHPRMSDIGYFELLRLDARDVGAWAARSPLADMGFDALEVFNGDHYSDLKKVERCLADWFALLEAGHRSVATGNSDTHKLTYQEAGVPRNWVAVAEDAPGRFDERAFVDAVRAGRVIVSSGPFVRLRVGEADVGGTVSAGEVEVHVEVQAPPWIDVSKIDLYNRSEIVRSWTVAPGTSPRRFDERVRETVESGDFLLVVVRGDKPMTVLLRDGAKPFAFTNPIWVK